MSALPGATPRRHLLPDIRRFRPLVLIPLFLALLAAGVASADRPSVALRVSATDAARSGSLIGTLSHTVGGSSLIEVQAPGSRVLLAVSADGGQLALADQLGQPSGALTLAHADGSQLRITLPGLVGAGFSIDGSWLAVIDGRGALWRLDTSSGDASQIAAGPFLGSPIVAADDSLLLLSVSSVEAPFIARAVRVAPTGAVTPLSEDQLVYGAYPLADGGVAVVAHEAGRTLVRHAGAGSADQIAELESGAIDVVVAEDGDRIAYELLGRGVSMVDRSGATPRRLGAGARPCFAADASLLLVRRGVGTAVLAPAGSVLATTQGQAGLAGAVGCLP